MTYVLPSPFTLLIFLYWIYKYAFNERGVGQEDLLNKLNNFLELLVEMVTSHLHPLPPLLFILTLLRA